MPPVVQPLRPVTHSSHRCRVPRKAGSIEGTKGRRRGHVVKGHVTRTAGSATAMEMKP